MTIKEFCTAMKFSTSPEPELVLILPEFCYSKEFLKLVEMFKKYKLLGYANTVLNTLNWKFYPNGMLCLQVENLEKLYCGDYFYEGCVAYFDLYDDIYKIPNNTLEKVVLDDKLDFDSIYIQIFLQTFDTSYNRTYGYQGDMY